MSVNKKNVGKSIDSRLWGRPGVEDKFVNLLIPPVLY